MNVLFYDVVPTMAIGNATKFDDMYDLIALSDFITLHVPETPTTKGMFGVNELKHMKNGSYLLNLSRGTVVDIEALAEEIKSGHVAGAAIDVYPEEPSAAGEKHTTPLQGLPNVILTPHVGGSTEEAQKAIGKEVGLAMVSFINRGTTAGAVNFPQLTPPPVSVQTHRITNVHLNIPGSLKDINKIAVDLDCNIALQFLSTERAVGYLIMDVDQDVAIELRDRIAKLECSIRTLIIK
ncbi:D-3-phosphoglycerate dehydrogenase [Angomonas deanei]|uniref:D-isomer specific 2-hydroxyacid dehydrogenase, NAD binding domain containing protein, putative n=1 Tax=Angomonas deanei TaxID=59799 RepID=A0A7G2CTW9_9TRYP|nr:D-3-phosphoglycerate dehydrogenase [Angomonas deanei]CAD2222995.1 D-isomer specific 2-hydroxyacid dehydrogenase, NAD binding domain containing protein, putative [Angomonas deanei]|eukprot:EPY30576.1 D-3-phosphoglycerate dehydrogenase [Angomonas deanei]